LRPEDITNLEEHLPRWKANIDIVSNIGVLSGGKIETDLLQKLFPDAWITEISQQEWDLFEEGKSEYDIIVACNVFMYSRDPGTWFKHVLQKCKQFWIQDLIRSWRTDEKECADGPGGDSDVMRFCLPPEHLARVEHAYDLRQLSERTVDFVAYKTRGRPDKDALSFLMNLRGDL
jgi:hypothetical protein